MRAPLIKEQTLSHDRHKRGIAPQFKCYVFAGFFSFLTCCWLEWERATDSSRWCPQLQIVCEISMVNRRTNYVQINAPRTYTHEHAQAHAHTYLRQRQLRRPPPQVYWHVVVRALWRQLFPRKVCTAPLCLQACTSNHP